MNNKSLAAFLLATSLLFNFLIIHETKAITDMTCVSLSTYNVYSLHNSDELLNHSSKTIIFNYIQNNPGTHFRDICSNLGMPIGVVQYGVDCLLDQDLIIAWRDKRYKRFFEARTYSDTEKKVYSLMRRDTTRKILEYIVNQDGAYHQELATVHGLSSQAVTWQVKLLKSEGIIKADFIDSKTRYVANENVLDVIMNCAF